jgi:sulfur-oxidizing protein SoxA
MRGVAARYPAYDKMPAQCSTSRRIIDRCRTQRQAAATLVRESDDLLALTAFVAYQSRGLPLAESIEGPARDTFDRGRAFYTQRHGQMNLACTQCHDENWGKRLLIETISQGHPNAFPAYRLEWQSLGSLQRRIRACPSAYAADAAAGRGARDVELYLAWRAQGLRWNRRVRR